MSLINHRYRKLQDLSSGGFGDTFLAEDTQIPSGRRCVIKQLRPVTNDPEFYQLVQERFYREAVILEKLGRHPQIPELYAYFTENNQFYLVQEWVPGYTLEDLIQQSGRLAPEFVQPCLSNLLGVLTYVHEQQIIHRDIKPANIILRSTDNQPCLIDFGAVKEILSANGPGQSAQTIVIGTPGYIAPEQMRGRPTFASDLFSLGYTAIQALLGQDPRMLPIDTATGQLEWRSQLVGVAPSPLFDVIDRAIQTDIFQRYSTAVEMQQALMGQPQPPAPNVTAATVAVSPGATVGPIVEPESQNRKKFPGWILSAGVFLLLVGGAIAGAYFILQNQRSASPPLEPAPTETVTPEPTPTPSPSPTPQEPADPNLKIGDAARVVSVRSDDYLAVLSGPGIQNQQIGCLPYDAERIEVIGNGVTLNESVWLPIQYFGLQGWVSGRYLSLQSNSGGFPNVVPPSESIGGVRRVQDISANDADPVLFMLDGPGLRDAQGRDRTVVGCIPYDGTGLNVLELTPVLGQSDWAQVWYRGITGWVNSKYIR